MSKQSNNMEEKDYSSKKSNSTNSAKSKSRKGRKVTRRGSQNRSREPKSFDEADLSAKGRDNDPNWYFTNSELANQAAELSFQSMLGTGGIWQNYAVPTIQIFRMNPCPGISYAVDQSPSTSGGVTWSGATFDNHAGINLSAQKIYTLLSTFSGRTSQYGPEDVAIMILAISAVAELSEHMRRAFGLALTYNPRNRTLPAELLNALGFDAADLFDNIAAYRMQFNIEMTRINQIPLLDNVGYIRKARDIYQHIYVDSPSSMAQIFAYVPESVWQLDELTYSGGSILKTWQVYPSGYPSYVPKTMDKYMIALRSMISDLLTSSTLNIIYADLLNLANKMTVPTWQFDYLAENYVVMPEYNRNALLQMHNLDIIGKPREFSNQGTPLDLATYHVKATSGNFVFTDASTGKVLYNPLFNPIDGIAGHTIGSAHPNIGLNGTIVDMDTDSPSLEDRIESLRFGIARSGYCVQSTSTTSAEIGNNTTYDIFPALPDHYCTYAMSFKNDGKTPYRLQCNYLVQNSSDVPYATDFFTKLTFAPMVYMWNTADVEILESVLGELNFYTMIDYSYLARLNRLMYAGLFEFRV